MSRLGRPRVRRSLEGAFWGQVPLRGSWGGAAAAAGVSVDVAMRWVAEVGGVKPRLTGSLVRLSYRERCRIEDLRDAGWTQAAIARDLGRHRSTVSRELSRHRRSKNRPYGAEVAQARSDDAARRPKEAKLAGNPRLRREVQDRLQHRHSPEQIARRLRQDYPDDPEMWVSHETIYQSLYVQARGGLNRELVRHLRTGRALRKPRRRVAERRGRIPGMVNISQRPAEVADRAVPGHWEGDLILGSAASGSAVGTLVERTTRFVLLLHLPEGHTAPQVADAMTTAMARLPEQLRRSLTWDQGPEMANHAQIAQATGLSIYFCDPHSPWQRGSNENTNGLLRQDLPRKSRLADRTQIELDALAERLDAGAGIR